MPRGIYIGNKGRIPWNKGLKGKYKQPAGFGERMSVIAKSKGYGKWMKNKVLSEVTRKKMSDRMKIDGKIYGFKKGHPSPMLGKKHSEETRKKMKKPHLSNRGENNQNWKGGVTPLNTLIRKSSDYFIWRDSVWKINDYTCQKCKIKGCTLAAHHILNFSNHKDLMFDIENGITLCVDCHVKFHKKYGFRNNDNKQLLEFIN